MQWNQFDLKLFSLQKGFESDREKEEKEALIWSRQNRKHLAWLSTARSYAEIEWSADENANEVDL